MQTRIIPAVVIAAVLASGCAGGGSSSSISSTQQSAAVSSAQTAKVASLIGACVSGYVVAGVNGVIVVVGSPGITPSVTSSTAGTVTTTTVDYGTGVTKGTETISGSLTVVFDTSTKAGTITFTNFTDVTSQGTLTVNGSIQFAISATSNPDASTVQTENDLTLVNNGKSYHVTGSETVDASKTQGLVDVPTATLDLTASQGTLNSTATDLTFDNATRRVNGGTIHAEFQGKGSLFKVSVDARFYSETPTTGLVNVAIAKTGSIAVHIPVSDL